MISTLFLICTTISFGRYWEKITNIPEPFASSYWLDVYFLESNPRFGWVCGFQGMVIRTTDGGLTWAGSYIPNADHMESIHFRSSNIGYTSGVSGLFKSMDGGASWFDITPSGATDLWGSYFYDDNIGVVLGGGCNGTQNFWRTTDGGSSWNLFTGNLANSGLTDAIIYNPAGEGYASSSGRIWKTSDGGVSWNVFATTGANIWQEEITKFNSSFCVPYAGTNCSGQGGDGGMRFSMDNGANWLQYRANTPMFGTFLINETTAWACGYNTQVYYTNDGGNRWLVRNCGIPSGSLDDLWFVDDTTGWLVGEGVYKLAPSKQTFSKDKISFGEICIPSNKNDTVWIKNYSFDGANLELSFNPPNSAFRIIRPSAALNMAPCDSAMIVVIFQPDATGTYATSLIVSINSDEKYTLQVNGTANVSTVRPEDTLFVIDSARCGKWKDIYVKWTADNSKESIVSVEQMSGGKNEVFTSFQLPVNITPASVSTLFSINPADTGWNYARFKFHIRPCEKDTFITFKYYGYSPIITTENKQFIPLECITAKYDSIPVKNTGNADLVIKSVSFFPTSQRFSFIGWKAGRTMPFTLKPEESDTAIILFTPASMGLYNGILKIYSNDSTTARGLKTPLDINITGSYSKSILSVRDSIIDFGTICLGSSVEKYFVIKNTGNLKAFLVQSKNVPDYYKFNFGNNNFPVALNFPDSVLCRVKWQPDISGSVRDTILLVNFPCDEYIRLILTGKAIEYNAIATPKSIDKLFGTEEKFVTDVIIQSLDSFDVPIIDIRLSPAPGTDWQYSFSPSLPVTLNALASDTFQLSISSLSEGIYKGNICVTLGGQCPKEICLPINLQSIDQRYELSSNSIYLGLKICKSALYIDSVKLKNSGVSQDTITGITINPNALPFFIFQAPKLPLIIKPGESASIVIGFIPLAEGKYTSALEFSTSKLRGKILSVPLSGEYGIANTQTTDTILDFGTFEYCEPEKEIIIHLQNTGTLDDSLQIAVNPAIDGFIYEPNKFIFVKSKDSANLRVVVNPGVFPNTGDFIDTLFLKSKVCENLIKVIGKVKIIQPTLTITPKENDLGKIWMDDSSACTVTIINNSGYKKTITGAMILQQPNDYIFTIPLPYQLNNGDSLVIPVKFNARHEGSHTNIMIILEESKCKYTDSTSLKATVPTEEYFAKIRIGNYTASFGDTISIFGYVEDSIPRVKPTKVLVEVSFDKQLFYPNELSFRYGASWQIIPFNYIPGKVTGEITGNAALRIFEKPDAVVKIKGNALLSTPDSTLIYFSDFTPVISKIVNITKIDGSLKLNPFCKPIGEYNKLSFIPTSAFALKDQSPSDKLLISAKSTGEQTCNYGIYDLIGSLKADSQIKLRSGDDIIQFDLTNLTSGTYFIKITTQYGQVWVGKFVKM